RSAPAWSGGGRELTTAASPISSSFGDSLSAYRASRGPKSLMARGLCPPLDQGHGTPILHSTTEWRDSLPERTEHGHSWSDRGGGEVPESPRLASSPAAKRRLRCRCGRSGASDSRFPGLGQD